MPRQEYRAQLALLVQLLAYVCGFYANFQTVEAKLYPHLYGQHGNCFHRHVVAFIRLIGSSRMSPFTGLAPVDRIAETCGV